MTGLAVCFAVGFALLGISSAGLAHAEAAGNQPTIAVSPAQAAVGDTLTVDLAGWPSGTVLASVCSNGAANGSSDCSLPGQRTVEIRPDGTGQTRLTVNPPGRCPCVVRVTTPHLDVVRSLEIAVPQLGSDPLPGAEPASGPSEPTTTPSTAVAAPQPASTGADSVSLALVLALGVLTLFGVGVAAAWLSGRRNGRRSSRTRPLDDPSLETGSISTHSRIHARPITDADEPAPAPGLASTAASGPVGTSDALDHHPDRRPTNPS